MEEKEEIDDMTFDMKLVAVPIYRLSCNMERSAAKVAYEGMQGCAMFVTEKDY